MGGSQQLGPGTVHGDYEIDSLVGVGANAVVYLAKHRVRNSWHALKLLHRMDSRRKIRIEQEAIFRDDLRHPNIVPATACIEIAGEPALVMEFVEGMSLSAWMRNHEPTLLDVLSVFRGMAEGIRHAHASGVVHRDLKPSNVLLQPGPDDTWVPRISDFGLAKALAPEMGKFGGVTTVNTGLGTPGYAAPEQVRDASGVGPRADLYSLGAILYEMVCGVGPFGGMSTFDTLAAQRDNRFTPPEEIAPGLPQPLYQLIRKLLSADPLRRPESCDAVLADVDQIYAMVAPLWAGAGAGHSLEQAPHVTLGSVLTLCAIPMLGLIVGAAVVLGGP